MEDIKKIAFFPLNICLLPGEDIPLKVFEPRYKQLINDCESEKFSFGIPFLLKNEMQLIGTEVKLKQILATNSHGEMVITVEGIGNFELLRYNDIYNDKLYAGGTVKPLEPASLIQDEELVALVEDYSKNLEPSFLKDMPMTDLTSLDIARALNLSSEDKFVFLAISDPLSKEKFLKNSSFTYIN